MRMLWSKEREEALLSGGPLRVYGTWRAVAVYFGGAGVKTSRLRPGSGLGLGLGAFLTSFLPLSLFPMRVSMTQKDAGGKSNAIATALNVPLRGLTAVIELLDDGGTVPASANARP